MAHSLHSLLHLISISIGISLAYIALERFRYAKKISAMFSDALKRAYTLLGENRKDTVLTRIKRKLKEPDEGIGPKLLFGKGPKLFGSPTRYGFDSWCMGVVLSIQSILLIYVTINYEQNDNIIFWIIFGISCVTPIFPLVFIYGGKWQLNKYQEFINNMIGDIDREYQLNINELYRQVED